MSASTRNSSPSSPLLQILSDRSSDLILVTPPDIEHQYNFNRSGFYFHGWEFENKQNEKHLSRDSSKSAVTVRASLQPTPQIAVDVRNQAVSGWAQSDAGTSQPGKERLVQLLHDNSCKPSAALPSHRMGGFSVSSWLQLLLCIEWPWLELIFLSFKTDDKPEL